jgi:sarcosine oxidase subunit alpha
MKNLRLSNNLERVPALTIYFDGRPLKAYPGETIATALLAAGVISYGRNTSSGQARSVFCNIGQCHNCLMIVNGQRNTRICQTEVTEGCRVQSQFD